jgi:hypothetical protein
MVAVIIPLTGMLDLCPLVIIIGWGPFPSWSVWRGNGHCLPVRQGGISIMTLDPGINPQ